MKKMAVIVAVLLLAFPIIACSKPVEQSAAPQSSPQAQELVLDREIKGPYGASLKVSSSWEEIQNANGSVQYVTDKGTFVVQFYDNKDDVQRISDLNRLYPASFSNFKTVSSREKLIDGARGIISVAEYFNNQRQENTIFTEIVFIHGNSALRIAYIGVPDNYDPSLFDAVLETVKIDTSQGKPQ